MIWVYAVYTSAGLTRVATRKLTVQNGDLLFWSSSGGNTLILDNVFAAGFWTSCILMPVTEAPDDQRDAQATPPTT